MKTAEIADYGKQTKGAFNRTRQDVRLSDKLIFPTLRSRFIKDNNELNFYDKLHHFERFISLNDKTSCSTIHVSLNLDLSEKIDTEKLQVIANKYMEGLGFVNQPYLVYKHNDAGHPHIHIASFILPMCEELFTANANAIIERSMRR